MFAQPFLRALPKAGFRAFPASLLDPLISFATDWPHSHPLTLEETEDLVSAFGTCSRIAIIFPHNEPPSFPHEDAGRNSGFRLGCNAA